jgi:hypothetical protein
MADLDRISTVRPVHQNEPRRPRRRPAQEPTSDESEAESAPKPPADDTEHQVDDYA